MIGVEQPGLEEIHVIEPVPGRVVPSSPQIRPTSEYGFVFVRAGGVFRWPDGQRIEEGKCLYQWHDRDLTLLAQGGDDPIIESDDRGTSINGYELSEKSIGSEDLAIEPGHLSPCASRLEFEGKDRAHRSKHIHLHGRRPLRS